MISSKGKALAKRSMVWQCGVLCILAVFYTLFAKIMQADAWLSFWSFLLGGAISILANGYFAWKLLTHTGARAAQRIVANLYLAEAFKLLILAAGLAMVFASVPAEPIAVLVGFVATYLTSIIVLSVSVFR